MTSRSVGARFRLAVVVCLAAAALALVPSASAASHKAFHLEKVCDTGTHCTVTASDLGAIPVGTEINYSGPDLDHRMAVFIVQNGSATGQCAIGSIFADPSLPGTRASIREPDALPSSTSMLPSRSTVRTGSGTARIGLVAATELPHARVFSTPVRAINETPTTPVCCGDPGRRLVWRGD